MTIRLRVNHRDFSVEASPGETLLELLRRLGFTSVKKGCETGHCGACTVLLDERAVASCIVLAAQANGSVVETIEGISTHASPHPVQRAFIETGAPQCGFCTPGMIMSAIGFLAGNPNPTREEVREAISGNICRCSGYVKIVDAIMDAASKMNAGREASKSGSKRP